MKKELIGGLIGSALSATGTALQPSEVLQIISLCITIVGGIISMIVIPLVSWWNRAHQDGKITPQEIKEGLDIVQDGIENIKDNLDDKN